MAEGASTNRRGQYMPVTAAGFVLADRAGAAGVVADKANATFYVQRVVLSITTAAAQVITVRDSNGTPLVIASLAASAALGPYEWNFGEDGLPLTSGKGVNIVNTAGPAYAYIVEGYWKPNSPLTQAQAAAL